MNFVLSVTTTLSRISYFFLKSAILFSKIRSSMFVGYAMVETIIIALNPAIAKKRSVISFYPPFSLSYICFLVLALVAKNCSHVSKTSESSRDKWYPTDDAVVVMHKVSTSQSLIKLIFLSASHQTQGQRPERRL